MNKIYLLSPYTERAYRFPQSSLEYIRFYLLDHGYDPQIIDCSHYGRDLQEVISLLQEDKDPVIGITSYTRERFNAYELIKKIRQAIPESLIIVGGHHFGFLAEETLTELPEVDVVVRGEGEVTFKEICDALRNQSSYSEILGISYTSGGTVVHNPDRPLEQDIDRFRNFDKDHLPDPERYSLVFPTKLDKKQHSFIVSASRGCPNRCVFCSLKANRVRLRSIDSIIDEIEEKIRITGIRNVSFNDPSLTVKQEFLVALCERILQKDLKITWNCYSRVDIDVAILTLMKKAGLVSVEMGLESASTQVLKAIKKNINLSQFEAFCREAYRLGIRTYVFCMISLPAERVEDVDVTISFLKKMSKYITSAGMQTTRILPDASLYGIARQKKILPPDFSWFKPYCRAADGIATSYYNTIPVYREHLSPDEIRAKLAEFNAVKRKKFTTFYQLKGPFQKNLRLASIRSLTISTAKRKTATALSMLLGAVRNRLRQSYYEKKSG